MKKKTNYKERFIKKSGSVAREGRQVYISPEFHTKIRRIVAIIGNNDITVHDYIQNVMQNISQDTRTNWSCCIVSPNLNICNYDNDLCHSDASL